MRPQRSTRLRDAALRAAARGWPVFPLWPRTKKPVVFKWEARATTDPGQIHRWWKDAPYNVGIACGPANLVVIDLDTGHGESPPEEFAGAAGGSDVLEILAARAGQPVPWDTYTVATPSGGGLHLYFTAPPEVALRNTASQLGWRVDSRAGGGYIVGEGSVRAEGTYRVVNEHPVAPLPDWVTCALARPEALSANPTARRAPLTGRVSAYVAAIVDDETDAVRAAAPGTRNHTLNRAAWTLGRLVAGGELTEDQARTALERAVVAHLGIAGFTATEARRTITAALAAAQRAPRQLRQSD